MIASENNLRILWLRQQLLELMQISLRLYAHTKEKQFLDFAKLFGADHKQLKNEKR